MTDTSWQALISDVTREPFDERPWHAIDELLHRNWWYRVWIVQESTTQVHTFLCCGKRSIHWSDVSNAVTLIFRIQDEIHQEDIKEIPLQNFNRLRTFQIKRMQGGEPLKLLSSLDDLQEFEASNLKDNVYAVIGFASDVEGFVVNYNKTHREVFLDVARYSVTNSPCRRQLDFLGLCPVQRELHELLASEIVRLEEIEGESSTIVNSPEEVANMDEFANIGLPSWVPDWRIERSSYPFPKILQREPGILGGNTSLGTAYSASGKSVDRILPYTGDEQYISINGDELVVKGFKVDHIAELSTISRTWDGKYGTPVQKTWELHHIGSTYFTGESVHEAFLHTIVADVKVELITAISWNHSIVWPDGHEIVADTDFLACLNLACLWRRLAITKDKLIGLVLEESQIGDKIFVLFGGQVLYVLRPVEDHYLLIGECYIHGLMDGQALNRLDDGTALLSTIRIR